MCTLAQRSDQRCAGLFVSCDDGARNFGLHHHFFVVVLFLVKKFELSLAGIFQFFGAIEKEEWNLDTFCDLYETWRLGSPAIPLDCWSRYGMSGPSRCLRMDAQGTLKSWSRSNMAKFSTLAGG